MRSALKDTTRRYSPTAIDMHFVLDMSLRTRYVLRTIKGSEYHIETDRKGGYIEFAMRQIYRGVAKQAYIDK